MNFSHPLGVAADLTTSVQAIESYLARLNLEKRLLMTPYTKAAAVFKSLISGVDKPKDLLTLIELKPALLTAAGVPDPARNEMTEARQNDVIREMIEQVLEPAGTNFLDELVLRYQAVGAKIAATQMGDLADRVAIQKITRTLIAVLALQGKSFSWFTTETPYWISGNASKPDIERLVQGLHWRSKQQHRLLLYNLTIPTINQTLAVTLLQAEPTQFNANNGSAVYFQTHVYLALGELKGSIDPAGADEHWKTANTALTRARNAFAADGHAPHTFFIGAAIAPAMAEEIFLQLQSGQMSNAANLTSEQQLAALCQWLITL